MAKVVREQVVHDGMMHNGWLVNNDGMPKYVVFLMSML